MVLYGNGSFFSKYHFCSGGWILGTATMWSKSFNFWHGALGKHIMYDVIEKPKYSFLKRWLLRHNIKNIMICNISDFVNQHLRKTYRMCDLDVPLILGQPRIRPLLAPLKNLDTFLTVQDTFSKKLLEERQNFETVYLYAPTYRDSGADFLKELHLDLYSLNEVLIHNNALMTFKMPPLCNIILNESFSNIRFADKQIDIYPLVAMSDVIISDYSSLYFDVLVCKDKKQLLLHGDIDTYRTENRDIYEEHLDDMTKGLVLKDFRDLNHFINGKIAYIEPPTEQLLKKYWDKKLLKNPDLYLSSIK